MTRSSSHGAHAAPVPLDLGRVDRLDPDPVLLLVDLLLLLLLLPGAIASSCSCLARVRVQIIDLWLPGLVMH